MRTPPASHSSRPLSADILHVDRTAKRSGILSNRLPRRSLDCGTNSTENDRVADYGYRYYDPLTGRWPSRDPIEEEGGVNLYGFVMNAPTFWIDLLGLELGKLYDTPEEATDAGGIYAVEKSDANLKIRQDAWEIANNKAKETESTMDDNAHGSKPSIGWEYGGSVCCKEVDGERKFYHTDVGTSKSSDQIYKFNLPTCPEGKHVALFHNHPGQMAESGTWLSYHDKQSAKTGFFPYGKGGKGFPLMHPITVTQKNRDGGYNHAIWPKNYDWKKGDWQKP